MEKSKPILVYCASGGRSRPGCHHPRRTRFYGNLQFGGWTYGWQNAGFPVTQAKSDLTSLKMTEDDLTALIQNEEVMLINFYAPFGAHPVKRWPLS